MKQTTMQFNGMMANFWYANAAQEIKYCERNNEMNGCGLSLGLSKNNAATIHAATPTGHEGHTMPMPAKPPAATPATEKVKPKVPPPSPAAKRPAKTADSADSVARAQ